MLKNEEQIAEFIRDSFIKDPKTSYEKIGQAMVLEFGIKYCRERVRQVLTKHYPNFVKERKEKRAHFCPKCGIQTCGRGDMTHKYYCFECYDKLVKERKARWSKNETACKLCHSNKNPHWAKGFCGSCYLKHLYHTSEDRRISQTKYNKLWASTHKDEIKKIQKKAAKKYYLANKEKVLEYGKKWRTDNPEKHMATVKKWQLNHLEKYKEISRKASKKYYHTVIKPRKQRLNK